MNKTDDRLHDNLRSALYNLLNWGGDLDDVVTAIDVLIADRLNTRTKQIYDSMGVRNGTH